MQKNIKKNTVSQASVSIGSGNGLVPDGTKVILYL